MQTEQFCKMQNKEKKGRTENKHKKKEMEKENDKDIDKSKKQEEKERLNRQQRYQISLLYLRLGNLSMRTSKQPLTAKGVWNLA